MVSMEEEKASQGWASFGMLLAQGLKKLEEKRKEVERRSKLKSVKH